MKWDGTERRENKLSTYDIEAITAGVSEAITNHICRFPNVSAKEMEEAIPFILSFKGVVEKTGWIVWKIIIGGVALALMGWTFLGFVTKIRGKG